MQIYLSDGSNGAYNPLSRMSLVVDGIMQLD